MAMLAVLVLAGLNASVAVAQSNSLRRARRVESQPPAQQQQPAAQAGDREQADRGEESAERYGRSPSPAPPRPRPIFAGPEARRPLTMNQQPAKPPMNPAVRAASLIAVELPQPEKVIVGDLVTIIVREDKKFTSDSRLKSDKDWQVKSEFAKWFRLDPHDRLIPTNFPNGTPGVDFDFQSGYEGKGQFDREDSLITRIQALVIDVKPNGNLVLEAKKRITIDEEDQIATLTGVCRSKDLTAQNSVLSTQVADLEIAVSHSGATRDAARRGWLMRLFDLLRPI
jgi:flagellar L-ring protein precursor FlgH